MAADVSIHAPTRGATELTVGLGQDMARFNPRAHAGRDMDTAVRLMVDKGFNPRAHAGRDPKSSLVAGL